MGTVGSAILVFYGARSNGVSPKLRMMGEITMLKRVLVATTVFTAILLLLGPAARAQAPSPPTISKSFGTSTLLLGQVTSLTFTIANANATAALTGISFTDTLPVGLAVGTPNALTGSCDSGTITAVAGTSSITLAGATLAAGASCTFSLNVAGVATGILSNAVSVTATESGTASTSAVATITVIQLNDPNEPGSLLVFPKFVRGTVAAGVPATEIEISVHCPLGLQPCAVPGTSVKLMGHWVCPGQAETQVCKENNFTFNTTVEGTVSFNTEGSTPPANFATVKVPAPLCPEGYLIVWAVNASNQPIKFDGLVGDAIVRWNGHAAGSYKGYAIQASAGLTNNALIATGAGGNGLIFDGFDGHYAAITGTVMGAIKYDTLTPAADAPVTTTLTLLTLDTLSNRPNNQVFTDIDFYDTNENVLSEATNYVCWSETALSTIDANLTRDFMSRKGFFVSLDAVKVPEEGIVDTVGAVTQIGLIDTQECPGSAACSENVPVTSGNNPTVVNHYAYRTDDDSVPVPTTFTGP
jgi:uncharacterized repeat protein (TIGR01451 family)